MRDGGNQWSGYPSYLSFFRHVAKLPLDYSSWSHYEDLAAFGPRFVHPRFCIVSELPEFLHRDEGGRAHCSDGAYCRWPSGRELYYWHGTQVPAQWLTDTKALTAAEVLACTNVEQRRAGAEIVGWSKILADLKADIVDVDPDPLIGTLLQVDLPEAKGQRFLRVRCGTGRDFCIPVDPGLKTALAANAWTYGVDTSTDINQFRDPVRT